jgi:transposase
VIQLGEVVMILEWHRQGMSVSAIARQSGLDRKTIRKYIHRGLEPPAVIPRFQLLLACGVRKGSSKRR